MPATCSIAVRGVLDGQRQLITPRQATEVGAHRSTLARMVAAGELEPIEVGVYGTIGVPLDWERRLLAVLLSAGPPAMASHRAVARLLGIDTYEAAPLEISVPSKRRQTWDGVIVHESRDLRYVPPIFIRQIPCTPPRRLAVDLGAVVGPTAYTTVIRDLRRDHGVSWRQLAAILELHSKRGRDGCGPLRRQLERYAGVDGIPDSTLEQLLLDHLIDAGFPLPVCQHEVPSGGERPYRIDFAYVDVLLAIEVDGPHHRLPKVRARDRRRDARLEAAGWKVVRIDHEALTFTPGLVLMRIREALRERGGWPAA